MKKIICLVSLVSFFFMGCATSTNRVNSMVGYTQPLPYKEGYQDGCDSGYDAAGHFFYKFAKDPTRYLSDAMYKQGWDDGFNTCKGKLDSFSH